MDHQAFAQMLGNYGEFIGALAVLMTLIYLAMQTRATRISTELQTYMASMATSIATTNALLSSTPASGEAYVKGMSGVELSDEELTYFWMTYTNTLSQVATIIESPSTAGKQRMLGHWEKSLGSWWSNPNFLRLYDGGGFAYFPHSAISFLESTRPSNE
jgi:hypothetical protein